nr:hypothetical protein [Tanacetum cinerariifolium]
IMGEPLSPDHVFDFHVDELQPHPAYDFFTPGPLPMYAVGMDEDIAMLFGDDYFEDEDFSDDDSEPLSVYKVEGPSTAAAKGQSFPLPVPGLSVPPSVIEDLSTRLGKLEYDMGSGDGVPDGSYGRQIRAERHADSTVADYGFGDEQP